MTPTPPFPVREFRQGGGSSPRDMAFTEDELNRINLEHDRRNGWSPYYPNIFSNVKRLPESFFGPIEKVWDGEHLVQ